MPEAYTKPVPSTPADAVAAFEEDLAVTLQGRSLADAHWLRPDALTLVIPLVAGRAGSGQHLYFLRLSFGYYRTWPPSAQFVNPLTLQYEKDKDKPWLPIISGTQEIAVHADYGNQGQLICCSNTLEFYRVGHSVEPKHMWNPQSQNFASTVNAVESALRSEFYKGRMA